MKNDSSQCTAWPFASDKTGCPIAVPVENDVSVNETDEEVIITNATILPFFFSFFILFLYSFPIVYVTVMFLLPN